jgi:chromate reductase, NAD(P)H dehydrogenase (quinone)
VSSHRNVAVIVGSLRQGSLNRMTAKVLATLASPALQLAMVEIGDLPLYNQDLDDAPPAPWTAFRAQIAAADAILFVTPEYNRSIPGALKNAIDVGSRPSGHSVWNGKPTAIVSVSPGAIGRVRRESFPAPGDGFSEYAGDATAGSLPRRCRSPLR